MRCSKCKSEFTQAEPGPVLNCPYCGEETNDPMSNLNSMDLSQVLFGIVLHFGKDKLTDPQLIGIVSDLMPEVKSKYIRIIKQAIDDRIGKILLDIENEDSAIKAATIYTVKNNFKEKNGFNNSALYVFDCFLYALGWIESVSKETYLLDSSEGTGIISQQFDLAIIDGSLKKEEIQSLFINAEKLGISEDEACALIRKRITASKLKQYPGSGKSHNTQKDFFCSSDWYSEVISGTYAEIVTPEGDDYRGEILKGKPHGRGIVYCSNGDKYTGEFKNGLKHGKGIMNYANLENYEGEWAKNLPNGRGVYRWPSGEKYKGELKNGKFHGKGTLKDNKGLKYSGTWIGGKMIEDHLRRNNNRISAYNSINLRRNVLPVSIKAAIIGFVLGIAFCVIAQSSFTDYLYVPIVWASAAGIVIPGLLYMLSHLTQSNLLTSPVSIGIHLLILLIISGAIFYKKSLEIKSIITLALTPPIVKVDPVSPVLQPESSVGISTTSDIVGDREIQSPFWKKTINRVNLLSLYKSLNAGKTEKIQSLITEDSELSLILYSKRFFRQDKLFNRRQYQYNYDITSLREYMVDSSLSYFRVEFQLIPPKRNQLDSNVVFITESLSPWIKIAENGQYQDSVPVIEGKIEFNYGKDKGLLKLNRASIATVNVNWLNIREAPSLNSRVIGKLKGNEIDDRYASGALNEITFQDNMHTIFADMDSERNGFVLCYIIDGLSGRYGHGYLWKEYLDINDHVWKGKKTVV